MIVLRDHVFVDIDHTISNAFWRDPMIGAVTWDEYHAANSKDEVIYEMKAMLNALDAANYQLIGFTARPAKWRKQTLDWLLAKDVPLDDLLMRPDDNYRPAPEVKLELVRAFFKGADHMMKSATAFILDDREDVCAAFKGLGITALQVHARREVK